MKIWKNKDETRGVFLGKVSSWTYVSTEKRTKEEHIFIKIIDSKASPTNVVPSRIELLLPGGKEYFFGEEADELYNILKSQKEVL